MPTDNILEKMNNFKFWKRKKVFVTGHTGFKGTWLCEILCLLGADVYGYSDMVKYHPDMFSILGTEERMTSYIGDIRDYDNLYNIFSSVNPDIVFHLAAQPIVKESYKNPRYTYETNIMGTVNLLECIRNTDSVKSVVNITTDKVYDNREWCWGYRETDSLDGYDPYSNSKSCSELVTHSYIRSFFHDSGVAVSTARAGNVIGGGDFSADRIIPDCVRAASKNEPVIVRNPHSVRPYQHVLEPLFMYMLIAEKQYDDINYAGNYNIGPGEKNCVTTGELVDKFCLHWGDNQSWENKSEVNGPHEANFLKLDCSKVRQIFKWNPEWEIDDTIKYTVEWYKAFYNNENMLEITLDQIRKYILNAG